VHRLRRAHHAPPERLSDRLMPQAHAEHGDVFGAFSTASREIPASLGVHGPGDITILSGLRAGISPAESSSLRRTTTSAPSSPRYCTRLYVKES
jgi:hypothetical protein